MQELKNEIQTILDVDNNLGRSSVGLVEDIFKAVVKHVADKVKDEFSSLFQTGQEAAQDVFDAGKEVAGAADTVEDKLPDFGGSDTEPATEPAPAPTTPEPTPVVAAPVEAAPAPATPADTTAPVQG